MPQSCEFELDHPNGVYQSGQTICGTIKFTTSQNETINNARLVLLGEGSVLWNESYTRMQVNGAIKTHYRHYSGSKLYINDEIHVRGEGVLPIGLHTYTFCYTLPLECPSSYMGVYGSIFYKLSFVLDKPLGLDSVFDKPLTVLQRVDLNLNPTYKLPLVAEGSGRMCCWPCSSGKILFELRTQFSGYSPGQTVEYSLSIQNQSKVNTDGYSVKFIQMMAFTAFVPATKQRLQRSILLKQRSNDSCLRSTNRVFKNQFNIPSVAPTSDPSDCIILVQYLLEVTIRMSGCHMSKDLCIPIFIGTIPLRDSLASCEVAGDETTLISPLAEESIRLMEGSEYRAVRPVASDSAE